MTPPVSPVLMSSDRMDWATPDSLFKPLDAEFGFTLDAAASADNARCTSFLDAASDGLRADWSELAQSGSVWVNPPYGRQIGAWVDKAAAEYHVNGCSVVMLVPARPDTKWWNRSAVRAAEIRFLRGRVRFVGAESCAPFPSALLIFDRRYHRPCLNWMDTP